MDFYRKMMQENKIDEKNVDLMPPLVLAYIGDAVFEVYVRTLLIGEGEVKVGKLHKKSIDYVKAKAQADFIKMLFDLLDEEERKIVMRGRNTNTATTPKNADIIDYRYATGFEALIGHLYLKGRHDRLMELLKACIKND